MERCKRQLWGSLAAPGGSQPRKWADQSAAPDADFKGLPAKQNILLKFQAERALHARHLENTGAFAEDAVQGRAANFGGRLRKTGLPNREDGPAYGATRAEHVLAPAQPYPARTDVGSGARTSLSEVTNREAFS